MAAEVQDVKAAEPPQPTIKPMNGYQTNCDEKDAKGKPCWGPLKVWNRAPNELRRQVPRGDLIYRCSQCWRIYHGPPHPHLQRVAAQK
jgi:hypothetical protein